MNAAVRIGGGGEPVRHPHPRRGQVADHLPQGGVLAADLVQVGQAQVGEPPHVVAHVAIFFRQRVRDCRDVCRITVDISSTDFAEELIDRDAVAANIASARRSSQVHCSSEA